MKKKMIFLLAQRAKVGKTWNELKLGKTLRKRDAMERVKIKKRSLRNTQVHFTSRKNDSCAETEKEYGSIVKSWRSVIDLSKPIVTMKKKIK